MLLLNFHSIPLISTAPTLYSVAPPLNNLFCSYMRIIKRYFFSSISHQVNHVVLRAKAINTPGHPHKEDRITQSIKGHKSLSSYTYFSSSSTHTFALIHIVIPLLHTIFPPTLLYTFFPLARHSTTPLVFIHYSSRIFTNLNTRVSPILVGCLFLQRYGNHPPSPQPVAKSSHLVSPPSISGKTQIHIKVFLTSSIYFSLLEHTPRVTHT